MKIDKTTANQFIAIYRDFLLDLFHHYEKDDPEMELTEKLVIARRRFSSDRTHLKKFIKRNKSLNVHQDIISAIEEMEISRWVYLKDTKNYSIMLKADGSIGYGVLGLNDRIRDIAGKPAIAIEAGIIRIKGNFVCDGLIIHLAEIGPNYKKGFNQLFKELKEKESFKIKVSV